MLLQTLRFAKYLHIDRIRLGCTLDNCYHDAVYQLIIVSGTQDTLPPQVIVNKFHNFDLQDLHYLNCLKIYVGRKCRTGLTAYKICDSKKTSYASWGTNGGRIEWSKCCTSHSHTLQLESIDADEFFPRMLETVFQRRNKFYLSLKGK